MMSRPLGCGTIASSPGNEQASARLVARRDPLRQGLDRCWSSYSVEHYA